MNRKHFIQLTGASLVTLLMPDFVKAESTGSTIIQLPDEVKTFSGDNYFSLQSSGKRIWTCKDVIVKLKNKKDFILVFVQSPTLALKEVQLSWK